MFGNIFPLIKVTELEDSVVLSLASRLFTFFPLERYILYTVNEILGLARVRKVNSYERQMTQLVETVSYYTADCF